MDSSSSSSQMEEEGSVGESEQEFDYDVDDVDDEEGADEDEEEDEEEDANDYDQDEEDEEEDEVDMEAGISRELSATLSGVVSQFRLLHRPQSGSADGFPEVMVDSSTHTLTGMAHGMRSIGLEQAPVHDAEAFLTAWDVAINGVSPSGFPPTDALMRLDPISTLPSRLRHNVHSFGIAPATVASQSSLHALDPSDRVHPVLRRRRQTVDFASPPPSYRGTSFPPQLQDIAGPDLRISSAFVADAVRSFVGIAQQCVTDQQLSRPPENRNSTRANDYPVPIPDASIIAPRRAHTDSPFVSALPESQHHPHSVAVDTLSTDVQHHSQNSDDQSFSLETNSQVSALLHRRYDPLNSDDVQGANFATLVRSGLLGGLGPNQAPPLSRPAAYFSFLIRSEREDPTHIHELHQRWTYDPPMECPDDRWIVGTTGRSQNRDHGIVSRSSRDTGMAETPGMDLVRDEIVKRIESLLRSVRDAHGLVREFTEKQKEEELAMNEVKAEAENETNLDPIEAAAGDPDHNAGHVFVPSEAENTVAPMQDAEVAQNVVGVPATTFSTSSVMETEAAPDGDNSTSLGVPLVATGEGVAASTSPIVPRDSSSNENVPVEPALGTTGADITLIVERHAASAGVSLNAPASEDPGIVASALASTGIDPTFLAALPEDMRVEVLTHVFEQLTSSRSVELVQDAESTTMLSSDFLIALPPSLRSEVLEQEIAFRSRNSASNMSAATDRGGPDQNSHGQVSSGIATQTANTAENEVATFIASLSTDLREEILLQANESFLESLPSQFAAEARAVREREMGRLTANWRRPSDVGILSLRGDRPFGGTGQEGNVHQSERQPTPVISWSCKNDKWRRVFTTVDTEPPTLCDVPALKSLIRLLELQSSHYGKSLLFHVLSHLCKKTTSRRHILKLLFDIFHQFLPTNKQNIQSTASDERAAICVGDSDPGTSEAKSWNARTASAAVAVRRTLELLTSLCKSDTALAELIVLVPEASPEGNELESSSLLGVEGVHPLSCLMSLLCEPLFKRSSAHQEQLISLLATVCGSIPAPSVRTSNVLIESEGPIQIGTEGSNAHSALVAVSDGEDISGTEVATEAPHQDMPLNDASDSLHADSRNAAPEVAGEQNGMIHIPARFRVPAVRACDIRALIDVLLHDGSSDRTYQRVTTVLGQLGYLPSNRSLALECLSDCSSQLTPSICRSFDRFVSSLPENNTVNVNERSKEIQDFSIVASSDELKLLRLVKAISALLKGDESKSHREIEPAHEQIEPFRVRYDNSVQALWTSLGSVLEAVEAQVSASNMEESRTASLFNGQVPSGLSIRSLASGRNGGPASRVGGKVHSLAPVLARLSPVIESFFVYHGSFVVDSSQDQRVEVPRQNSDFEYSNSPSTSEQTIVHPNAPVESPRLLLKTPEKELGIFIERHRIALNAILRVNPQLLEGSFRPALRHAHAIDFDNKKAYFRGLIRKRSSEAHAGTIRITVRRDRAFEDSYRQLRSYSAEEMKGRLHVQFTGEEGIDAGGVTREWYVILARQIFDPNYALFCRSAAKAATYQPNKSSAINQEHLDNFRFVGRIFGKAIYDGQLLDAYFTRAFYKHILGIKPTYQDIEAEDPEYYKSLCWILENDITGVFEVTFSTEFEEFGQRRIIDLKPNGRNIPVTESNKEEYVRLVTEVKLTKAISKQIASFKEGFYELIPLEDCRIFNEVELELLTSGLPDIDVADLKANVEYTGYTAGAPQIIWFWTTVSRMEQEDLARLVMFVTGTSKVPLEGFSALQGMNGPQKFQIHRASGGTDRLPSAHTCFNQLDLPEYDSYESLSEHLLHAIRETEGFGFA